MTEKPILFSGAMIRAILAGRKTQTRRALKPQPNFLGGRGMEADPSCWGWEDCERGGYVLMKPDNPFDRQFHPRWAVGDRLWVRETWADVNTENGPAIMFKAGGFHFCADDAYPVDYARYPGMTFTMWCGDLARGEPGHAWRSPIHMPRWASRITLDLTGVRVERLQDISEADAIAEGIFHQKPTADDLEWYKSYCEDRGEDPATNPMEGVWIAPGTRQGYGMTQADRDREQWGPTAAFAYRCVWNHINGAGSWDANPWVAVIEFRRVTANA